MIALAELNRLPPDAFTAALDGIFEHSPWVAARAALGRPFGSRLQLLEALRKVVDEAQPEEQLALIRAHPRLAARGRSRTELTEASAREQHRAGLEACTAADFARLDELNAAYFEKFAMPFIIAVRGHTPASIIAACERRLAHSAPLEQRTALLQIGLIAGYRLAERVAEEPPTDGATPTLDEFLRQSRTDTPDHD